VSKARLVITAVLVEGRSQSEVARTYGISQSWISRIVKRYRLEGEVAFQPRSRRPHTSPTRLAQTTIDPQTEKGLNLKRVQTYSDVLRHHIVALERFWSNNMLQKRQNEISVTDVTGMVSSPASQRQRITARLRAEVIKRYDHGMSSRRVAATLGLGRTTVLKILRTAEVEVRPPGRKH
jgi:transposase